MKQAHGLHHVRQRPLSRRFLDAGDARGVFRRSPAQGLCAGRSRARRGPGRSRRDPARGGTGDRAKGPGDRARQRAVETRHRECRLSHRRPGAPALGATRRSRPLRALGRDHPGHHGHRDRAATARRGGADRSPARRGHGHARRSRAPASRYADGRANPSAAGAADHVRAQGRDLALGAAALGRSARTSQTSRPSGAARRRRRHAGVTRRTRTGCARRLRARARSRRARHHLACRPRRAGRDGPDARP